MNLGGVSQFVGAYLIVWHCEHIAKAAPTDVICDLIGDLERILEGRPTHCGHIWTVTME